MSNNKVKAAINKFNERITVRCEYICHNFVKPFDNDGLEIIYTTLKSTDSNVLIKMGIDFKNPFIYGLEYVFDYENPENINGHDYVEKLINRMIQLFIEMDTEDDSKIDEKLFSLISDGFFDSESKAFFLKSDAE